MHAIQTACAVALVSAALTPQGPLAGVDIRTFLPRYPAEVGSMAFQPFLQSGGGGRRVAPMAAGHIDLDGDGNQDLWFLGHGTKPGELAVQFGNTASLGRFHRRDPLPQSSFVTGATYHTTSMPSGQLLLVDPTLDEPMLLHWNPRNPNGDPRDGQLGGALSGWKIGTGVTEIAAADHSGDGHDDIVVLQVQNQTTLVHKLRMDTAKHGYLWVEEKLSLFLPAQLQMLRVFDADGDGRTDFVAHTPGIGVIACTDDGQGSFRVSGFWPTGNLLVRDLCTGDLNGDGLDDLAICLDSTIAILQPQAGSTPPSWQLRLFASPATVGPLATCRIVDASAGGTRLLVGFPVDGRNYVVHPHAPGPFGPAASYVETAPPGLVGPGVTGRSLIVADVDNDRDLDFVLQAPNGIDWLTLRNPTTSFAPLRLTDADLGPAPILEGPKSRRLEVTFDLPPAVMAAKLRFVEIGMWVADPDSPDPTDPDYLFWGRLMPAIDTAKQRVTFTVFFDEDPVTFEQRVKTYKQRRAADLDTTLDVYPQGQFETIRGGPRMFLSAHAIENSRRYESGNGNEPPDPQGSTLGGKWVLYAKPPSSKGDLDLLPFE